jgi:hypothetical protein
MDKERRKPVLGRVVPGVTPTVQRRLRGFFVFIQTFSSSLAGWLALLMFLKPPRRKVEPADAPIIALARRSTMRCGGDRFTVWIWENAGPSVVLLHGWVRMPRDSPISWRRCVPPATRSSVSMRLLMAPRPASSLTCPAFATARRSATRNEPIHAVIGHSLGGGAVLTVLAETADHHPRRYACSACHRTWITSSSLSR